MSKKKITLKPGQESVWDYPRPPRLEKFAGHVRIELNGEIIADSNRAYRVLETSHPPTFYIPEADFKPGSLVATEGSSYCEFKGRASYFDLRAGDKVAERVAWTYIKPTSAFAPIKDHVCVYAHKVDACYVNDEKVQAQEGDFYGGWIYSNIVGPFKGGQGTWGW